MIDRRFNDVDLREMLERSDRVRPDIVPGRWVAETAHDRRRWEIIVEPLPAERITLVITAYPIE